MKLFNWKDKNVWPGHPLGQYSIKDTEAVPKNFIEYFLRSYTHTKAYHACRPVEIESYYNKGILALGASLLADQLCNNFRQYCDIHISKSELDRAIKEGPRSEEGKVFLTLDDEFLLDQAGHYAIYGSEYSIALANSFMMTCGKAFKGDLLKFGKPTIFELAIPNNEIELWQIESLIRDINNYIYDSEQGNFIDFTFIMSKDVNPKHILRHYHPTEIKDPLNIPNTYIYAPS